VVQFVPSEEGVKMTDPLEIFIKDKKSVKVRCLMSEGMEGAEIQL
jgi:hypothetical protein